MDVREITDAEHETLAELTVAAYRALPEGTVSPAYEPQLRDVTGRAAGAVVLVAVDGARAGADGPRPGGAGRLLGGVTYVPDHLSPYAQFDDPEAAGIRMLAVDPHVRGRGAGTALVEACIERAHACGRARILLHSTPAMAVAQRLYLRLGFTRREDLDWQAVRDVHLEGFAYELPRRQGGQR